MGDNLYVTGDSHCEVETSVDAEMLNQRHAENHGVCDETGTSDHSYSSRQSDSDVMAWYCLGVA